MYTVYKHQFWPTDPGDQVKCPCYMYFKNNCFYKATKGPGKSGHINKLARLKGFCRKKMTAGALVWAAIKWP